MEFQIEEMGGWRRRATITIPVERVEREMEKVVESYRRKAALPGFRKGKAPTEVIRVRFHDDLEADLLNRLIPDAYEEALSTEEIRPVGPPRFHDIRFAIGEPLRFRADFEEWPRLEVAGFRDLALDQEVLEVDDAMIDEALERLRHGRAGSQPVERPSQPGDIVKALLEPIDVHGSRLKGAKREEVRMEAGSERLLPEFRGASLGISAGEQRTIEVVYPETFQDRQLAGKTRRFRMTAQQIEEKKLPPLDDEFARSIDANLDLEGLRAKIRLRLESEELMESKQRLEERLIDRLLEANRFEVPEVLNRFSLDRIVERAREERGKVDEDALRARFRPAVERMHRRDILLQNVARQETLEVDDEEIEAQLDRMAEEAGVAVEVLRRKMEADGEMDNLRDTLQERKVIDFLLAAARVARVKKPRPHPEGTGEGSRIITP